MEDLTHARIFIAWLTTKQIEVFADTIKNEAIMAEMAYYARLGVRKEYETFADEQAIIAASQIPIDPAAHLRSFHEKTKHHRGWGAKKLQVCPLTLAFSNLMNTSCKTGCHIVQALSNCRKLYRLLVEASVSREQLAGQKPLDKFTKSDSDRLRMV